MRRIPKDEREQADEIEAQPDHDAEAPEQRADVGNRVGGGARNGRRIGRPRVGDIAFEQQRVTEIGGMVAQPRPRRVVAAVLLEPFERVIRDQAVSNPLLRAHHQVVDSRQLLRKRARGDDAERPGNVDAVFDLARLCPEVILEPSEVGGRAQPSQIARKLRARLLDVALERVEFRRAHRLPCLDARSARAMPGFRLPAPGSCPASKLWPELRAGLCCAVAPPL